MITWKPEYRDFQDLFANKNGLRILAVLNQDKKNYCAADIAKLLDIHISTSKRYLDLFYKHAFIEKQEFPDLPGKPTYFSPKNDFITIKLDMNLIAQSMIEKLEEGSLPNPSIREKAHLEPRISYDIDDKGFIKKLTVNRRTKARRFVKLQVKLSKIESQFMKYVPHPTMEFEPFLQICKRAKLNNYLTMKSLLSFIEKMKSLDIIEEKNVEDGK